MLSQKLEQRLKGTFVVENRAGGANVIVFTICLGLADDYTIHFLYRFREELHVVHDVPRAIQRAFRGAGRAIVATSFLLLAGMAVLLLSNFIPTRRFAELTCVTIVGNLLGVLLLLPACLVLAWRPPLPTSGREDFSYPVTTSRVD
jgi:hypothetical protein